MLARDVAGYGVVQGADLGQHPGLVVV